MAQTAWFPENWFARTSLLCAKELAATLVFFIAYWRLRTYDDLLTLPLVLFTTALLFSPAFLSAYLFAFLRLGPWFSTMSKTKASATAVLVQLTQALLVAVAHTLGAVVAALLQRYLTRWYEDAAFVGAANQPVSSVTWRDSTYDSGASVFFDEFFAVAFMLASLLHLMLAMQKDLVVYKGAAENKEDRRTPSALPVPFVAFACVLVAGVARGFPAAHLSLGTSVFMGVVDGFTWKTGTRIAAGLVATLATVAYHHLFVCYLPATEMGKPYLANADAPPVFMQARILALPEHMRNRE